MIIPGGLQAGLQLVSGFTVPEGGSASFTVDFDLRNTIRPDNQFEGYYRMRRALRLVDNSEVGVITGAVDILAYPEMENVAATCSQDGDRCPGLSVSVHKAAPVEENSDPEQDTGSDEGCDTTVETSSVEEPLTTANVFAKHLKGEWEHQYTVGFLSPGSYDLDLTLDETILSEADGETVVAGGKTIVDFPVPGEQAEAQP